MISNWIFEKRKSYSGIIKGIEKREENKKNTKQDLKKVQKSGTSAILCRIVKLEKTATLVRMW